MAVMLVVHKNCPRPTGPAGTLLAAGIPSRDGVGYVCEACGIQITLIDIGADDNEREFQRAGG